MSTIRGCPLFGDFGRRIQYRGVDELTKCCLSSTVFFIQIWGFLYWEVSHHTNNHSPSQYQEHLIFFYSLQDNCPLVYNPSQSIMACMAPPDFAECRSEKGLRVGITWGNTGRGETALQPCPAAKGTEKGLQV